MRCKTQGMRPLVALAPRCQRFQGPHTMCFATYSGPPGGRPCAPENRVTPDTLLTNAEYYAAGLCRGAVIRHCRGIPIELRVLHWAGNAAKHRISGKFGEHQFR